MRRSRLAVPVIIAAGLLLAACGGSSTPGTAAAAGGKPWTDAALVHRLGLVSSEDGAVWSDPATGCDALVLLKNPQEVAVYDGDTWLVKSPSGSLGVKVSQGAPKCMTRFRELLATVPDQRPR